MDTEALRAAGFTSDARLKSRLLADAEPVQASGPYEIQGAWRRGEVVVFVERNTAPEDLGEMRALISYPPVAVVQGPAGRVAVNPEDTALILQVAQELSSA